MALVRLERGSKGANMFRKFQVYIDGTCVGTIRRKEKVFFEVPEGPHAIFCKIDWEKSNTLNVEVGSEGVDLLVNSKGVIESVYRSLIPFDGLDKYLVLIEKPSQ